MSDIQKPKTTISVEHRKYLVQRKLLQGVPDTDIIKWIMETYKVKVYTAREYVRDAYSEIDSTIIETDIAQLKKTRIEQLKGLYLEAKDEGNLKVALDIFKELTKMEGTAGSDNININHNYEVKFGDEPVGEDDTDIDAEVIE